MISKPAKRWRCSPPKVHILHLWVYCRLDTVHLEVNNTLQALQHIKYQPWPPHTMGLSQALPSRSSQRLSKGQIPLGRLHSTPKFGSSKSEIRINSRILFHKLISYWEIRMLILWLLRNWDEKRVGEWLRSINCAQYEQLFRGEQQP